MAIVRTFTKVDALYHCNQPGDNSGEYVTLADYEQLMASCRRLEEMYNHTSRELVKAVEGEKVSGDALTQVVGGLAARALRNTIDRGGTIEIPSLGLTIKGDEAAQ